MGEGTNTGCVCVNHASSLHNHGGSKKPGSLKAMCYERRGLKKFLGPFTSVKSKPVRTR